jgi:hypothetical protein
MTMPTFQIDRKFCYTQRSGIISHIGRTIAPMIEVCQQMRHAGILGHIPRFLRISICFSKDLDDLAETIGVYQNMIHHLIMKISGGPFVDDGMNGCLQTDIGI